MGRSAAANESTTIKPIYNKTAGFDSFDATGAFTVYPAFLLFIGFIVFDSITPLLIGDEASHGGEPARREMPSLDNGRIRAHLFLTPG